MRETIKIKNKFGDEIFGYAWTVKEPIGNMIIVTGMAETAIRYDNFAEFLCSNGYNVYCLDHYGQGITAKNQGKALGVVPNSYFSKEVKIIDQLVVELRASLRPTYIFGHSMGSFMVQDYIQRFTNHVNKVIICGSNGKNAKGKYSFGVTLTKLITKKSNREKPCSIMNKLAFGSFAKGIKNRKTDFDWLSTDNENVQKYINDPECGFVCSYGFFKEFMKGCNRLYKREFLKKIRKDMNVLVIAGSDDPVGCKGKGPTNLVKLYNKLGLENVQLKLYEGKRHEVLNETNRDEVYSDILKFLNEECAPAEEFLK